MSPTKLCELKRQVDQALAGQELTADARETLIEVVTPDPRDQQWPDVQVVLYVAEHPVVADIIADARLAEPLETALVEAFSAVMPLLGARAFGPLANFVSRTRQRLDAERRKYTMVSERLDDMGADADQAAIGLLGAYLSTSPAPMFVSRLRRRFSTWLDQAERRRREGVDLSGLTAPAGLVAALRDPGSAAPAEVADQLDQLCDAPVAATATLQRALSQGDADQQLVAAAVASFDARREVAGDLIDRVVSGADDAAHMSVMAAHLSPLAARQVFGQFLAEVSWQNPEEPDARITAERTHVILSARCVLPKLGSPMEPVDIRDVPASVEAGRLRQIPELVDAAWAFWQAIETA